MGTIGSAVIGNAIIRKQVNPKIQFAGQVRAVPNLLVLGGTGDHAAWLREQAMLRTAGYCAQHRYPALVLSGDERVTNEIMRLPNAVRLGTDVSYDPFADCSGVPEAVRVLESMLPLLSQNYGSGSSAGAMQLAQFLLETITESFGEEALMLTNLESVVVTADAHHDILSALNWMQETGYIVSESLKSELTLAWNNGAFTALTAIMNTLRRTLRFLRRKDGNELYSISALLEDGCIVVAEIPHGDRDAAVSVLCAEMINYIDHDGSFILLDYEVPLPGIARDLFSSGDDSVLFCTVMRSMRSMAAPHMQAEDFLAVSDTVLCLGMPNMQEAGHLAAFLASGKYTFMPNVANMGHGAHIGLAAMEIPSLSAQHLAAGSYRNRSIEDGGGAVFDPTRGTVDFYRNISVR